MVDSYDSVGNRTRREKDGTVTTWTYDAGYRLVSQVESGARATFAYDDVGNMTVKWHQGTNPMSFTYNKFGQTVTMLQGAKLNTYTYDDDGNLTEQNLGGTRTTNTYDDENRLIGVNSAGSLSTYTYAGTGLRRSGGWPGQPHGLPRSFQDTPRISPECACSNLAQCRRRGGASHITTRETRTS